MTNERGGIFRGLLFLVLLAGAAWVLYTRWWPNNNPQTFSGKLESAVNQELTRAGVTDRDVLSQLRKEHAQWGLTWVETQRTIRVVNSDRLQTVSGRLLVTAKRLGCSVEKSSKPDGLEIRITRFTWLLQKLTFIQSPKEHAGRPSRLPEGRHRH